VKMIYIDPPYNTGDDFVYNDDRKFTAKQLQDLAGVSEDEAKRILEFIQSNSNSHSAWLTFMYPRLYIAKQLLKDDGVIFVSIDDNEVAQLRILMDEVFGEENFVGQWNWFKSATPPNLSKKIKKNIEYILAFQKGNNNDFFTGLKKESKSDDGITKPQNTLKQLIFKSGILNTSLADGTYKKGIYGTDKYPNELLNDLIVENGKNKNEVTFQNRFTWTQDKLNEEISNHTRINLSKSLVLSIKKADYKPEVPPNFIDKNVNVDTTENAGRSLTQIFGKEKVFDYPKPVSLISYLINFLPKTNDDIILDFFAGSGTTAHAVMQLNAEDGGNRKYILVQLPELIDAKKSKVAYDFVKDELGVTPPTIFEITKERIIRAAKQIKESNATKIVDAEKEIEKLKKELPTEETLALISDLENKINHWQQQDLGFKIFETTPIWEDYDFKAEKLANAGQLFDDDKLTEADVKALFTTWKTYDGSPLTEPVQEVDLAGYTAYYTKQKLYLMYKGFSTAALKALLEQIDTDANFNPTAIIAFGYYFESKALREIAENIKTYNNKKNIDIDFITRY